MRNERRAFGSSFFMLFLFPFLGDRARFSLEFRRKRLITAAIVVAVKEDENAVNQHDCVFLMPFHSETDV